MNKGDKVNIISGKEKEPSHANMVFTVDSESDDNIVLKAMDGSLVEYTIQDIIIDLIASPATESHKKFPEPEILEAIVDPKEKPKEGPVPFSFTSPQQIHKSQAQPTKGDIEAKQQEKKPTLAEIDAEIKRDEKQGKDMEYDDYKDTAEMFMDFWEGTLTMICRGWSKDTSDSAYSFPEKTREKLIRQGIKVSRKRGWVIPIELLAGGTLMAATTTIAMKARDKRKEYLDKKPAAENNFQKEEITQGGPNKGIPKRRGPGRPSK